MAQRIVLMVLVAGLTGGCGWINSFLVGEDNALPPTELTEIADPIPIQTLWRTQVGEGVENAFIRLSPAVDDEKVYAASHDGAVIAVDIDSGQTLWRVETGLPITAGVGLGSESVLVGSDQGQVLSLNRTDGSERWRVRVSSEVLASPSESDGVVVVRSSDGKFTGLDAANGTRMWTYSFTVPALSLRGSAAPLLGQGVAISGLDTGKLLVLSLGNGVPVWEKTISPPRGRTELERMVDIDTEPAVVGSVLFVAAYQGNITAIDLRSGNTLWTRELSTHAGLAADRNRVYVSRDDDAVVALDSRSGSPVWRQEALVGRQLSVPASNGRHLVVGDLEGWLHWLRAEDGRLLGRVRADDKSIKGRPVFIQNVVYVLGDDGSLGAYRAAEG